MSTCGSDDPFAAAPPSAPVGQSDFVALGIVLVEIAVTMIAIGANVQRYGLVRIDPARRCGKVSLRSTVWLVGLTIYFSANIVYSVSLVFAPASLCAALFAARAFLMVS